MNSVPVIANEPMVARPMIISGDVRFTYFAELLQAVMAESEAEFGSYRVEPWTDYTSSSRVGDQFFAGRGINVVRSAPIGDLVDRSIPILIPIMRGLNGYRIFLIRAESQTSFIAIRDLDGLRTMLAGQGKWWPDVAVLQNNGLPVRGDAKYPQILSMLSRGRFDYVPLAASEITEAHARYKAKFPNLELERTLLLHYPIATYMFVSRTEPKLAERIKLGLEKMVASGALNLLWRKHHEQALELIEDQGRTIIRLENSDPLLEELLKRNEFWYEAGRK